MDIFCYELQDNRSWQFTVVEGRKNQSDKRERILVYTGHWAKAEPKNVAAYCFYIGGAEVIEEYTLNCHSFLELSEQEKYAYAHHLQWAEAVNNILEEKKLPKEHDPCEHTILAEIVVDL